MGVSGCGKSTIGKALADATGFPFYDGDDFHPQENIEKMSSGKALNDSDRAGWLKSIATFAQEQCKDNSLIIACSALKQIYREQLEQGLEQQVQWIYLKGSFDLIAQRMQSRKNHFMPTQLLVSQFETLEEPKDALSISIELTPELIIEQILEQLKL